MAKKNNIPNDVLITDISHINEREQKRREREGSPSPKTYGMPIKPALTLNEFRVWANKNLHIWENECTRLIHSDGLSRFDKNIKNGEIVPTDIAVTIITEELCQLYSRVAFDTVQRYFAVVAYENRQFPISNDPPKAEKDVLAVIRKNTIQEDGYVIRYCELTANGYIILNAELSEYTPQEVERILKGRVAEATPVNGIQRYNLPVKTKAGEDISVPV